ncbi:Hypothetical protein ETEE_2777 [Edwardsiella anguillarum ET080813]|uniref:Uncharacterized protein n=1 Tax=Edwardsiella anguillarum ET080813 TaxID=667120 RepID=A0A076LL74_9GAMM|nr:Hypothetical protein ETEE_2777 [Edwardsiella anguillarum ET080813]
MKIIGSSPPIPALIGKNKTPAPIAVPNNPKTQRVSVLRHVVTLA